MARKRPQTRMATGVALADSKRGWAEFGSTGAATLRCTTGRRPSEQNDDKKVTSGEHGEYKAGTCREQKGCAAAIRCGSRASALHPPCK